MYDFSRPLGDAVKSTRYQRGLTRNQTADMAEIDVRTMMNIENYKANPKCMCFPPDLCAQNRHQGGLNPELERDRPHFSSFNL